MKILKLKPEDESNFNNLALSHGTIFNTKEWTSIVKGRVDHYGIYEKDDRLIGGFITYKENKFGLPFYRNPPCTPTIGPFLKIDSQKTVTITDKWKKVLSLMADFFEALPYAVISFSLDQSVIDTQPFFWNKFKVIPCYTYIINLSQKSDSILSGFSTAHRNHAKKALKDGLVIEQITDMKIVKSLVLKTFSRKNKEADEFYVDKILFEFANPKNSFAFATYRDNKPIACSFSIHDERTAYNLLSGYDSENKHHGAGCMSIWEAIKYAKELGLKNFDFEGSMMPEIETYFRGFGGQLTPYYTINKAKLPFEMILKLFKRELF